MCRLRGRMKFRVICCVAWITFAVPLVSHAQDEPQISKDERGRLLAKRDAKGEGVFALVNDDAKGDGAFLSQLV